MREIRPSGSEGGAVERLSLPLLCGARGFNPGRPRLERATCMELFEGVRLLDALRREPYGSASHSAVCLEFPEFVIEECDATFTLRHHV